MGLAVAAGLLVHAPKARWGWLSEAGLPFGLVLTVVVAGTLRLHRPEPVGRTMTMALVQPSIPQELIWDASEDANRFEQLMALSRLAVASRPQVLVWPEAALPAFTEANYGAITNLILEHGLWMVFGADDVEPRRTAGGEEEQDSFNSAFLVGPDGRYRASYRKQRLVIFGEYVPWSEWLPILKRLTPIPGSFRPGREPVAFRIGEPAVEVGVLICFEDVFGHGARHHVREGTELLLNLTNDGWFGESSAQWQHMANAVFRAVENGLPLVRCTNNGLTCWIDRAGRIREVFQAADSGEYGRGFLVVEVPLGGGAPGRGGTMYWRRGDVFGWGMVGVTFLGRLVRGRKGAP
jgi:apolipoprotein N-acyltransferase